MMKHLARIDPQRIPMFAGAFILLVAAALVTYLILPQYKAHRAVSREQSTLHQTVEAARSVTVERARLQADVERLELELHTGELPQQALEAFVIGRLQDISWRREIELVAIQPSPGAQLGAVQETLFQLELAGEYADLHDWLRDIHVDLDSVTVKELSLSPLDSQTPEPRLRAGLVVAAYGSPNDLLAHRSAGVRPAAPVRKPWPCRRNR